MQLLKVPHRRSGLVSSKTGARHIAEWRKQYRETLQQFATRLDVSITTLANWEHGKKAPRQRMQQRVAERLGVKPEQIVYGEPSPKSLAVA